MAEFRTLTFKNQDIRLDDSTFIDVSFDNCRIIYGGSDKVTLKECSFTQCVWIFDKEASNTLQFLSNMYNNLGDDGAHLVETIFNSIKNIK